MTHRATVLALALVAAVGLPQIALGLSLESARHLLSRTTFGASPSDIDNLLELEPDKAVTHLIESARREAHTSPPEWVDEPLPDRRSMRSMDQDQRAEMRKLWRKRGMELKTWWYMDMVTTESPFTEKMTLILAQPPLHLELAQGQVTAASVPTESTSATTLPRQLSRAVACGRP